jgi:hypothetical protein
MNTYRSAGHKGRASKPMSINTTMATAINNGGRSFNAATPAQWSRGAGGRLSFPARPAAVFELCKKSACRAGLRHLLSEPMCAGNGFLLLESHDENNICRCDTVHCLIITHAVIPLLEDSGGQ